MHVLGHDGNSLSVDGAEVGVFEKTNHVGLRGFLEGEDGGGLESKVVLELRSDLSDESLERKFSNEKLSGLLELSNLSKSDGSRSESMGFLDTTSSGGLLLGLLVGNVFSGGFATGVLSSGLLGTGHSDSLFVSNLIVNFSLVDDMF